MQPSNLPPGVTDHMVEHMYGDGSDEAAEDYIAANLEGAAPPEPWDEVDPDCPHCGNKADQHHEESREDTYGNDYEVLACPPSDMTDPDELAHFAKHGCVDYLPAAKLVGDKWERFCEGCGEDR